MHTAAYCTSSAAENMGRNQVHSAQQHAVQQQRQHLQNSKAAHNAIKSSKQFQITSSCSQSSKQHQAQLHNAQVYRPTPVKEHPDDAFLTGAWMFDSSRVPQWMVAQLPQASANGTAQKPLPPRQWAEKQAGPRNTLSQLAQVYRPTPVQSAHPDDAFLSGAWLFDQSSIPQWLASQLPAQSSGKCCTQHQTQKKQQDPQLALLDGWAIDSLKPLPNAVEVLEAKEEQRPFMEIENQQRKQVQSSVRQRRAAELSGKRQNWSVQGV